MNVAIAGAHGQIALRLARLLTAEGDRVIGGPVPRDDVARVLARLLADSRSAGRVLYLSSGAQPVEQALDEVLGRPG